MTASDISQRALDRVAAEAERRGLRVECRHADANALDAFEAGAFDLVSAQYASIPRTPDGRGVRNLLDAVAPGGTLLVVSHDLEPMRAPIDTHEPQPAVRPRRLRPGRRLRRGARRLTGLGHRGPREAAPPARGRLRLAPRRRHRAPCPTPRQLTRPSSAPRRVPETAGRCADLVVHVWLALARRVRQRRHGATNDGRIARWIRWRRSSNTACSSSPHTDRCRTWRSSSPANGSVGVGGAPIEPCHLRRDQRPRRLA